MPTSVAGRLCILLSVFLFASTLTARADKRVALVIGNSVYQHTAQLANPVSDSTDVAAALEKDGFKGHPRHESG